MIKQQKLRTIEVVEYNPLWKEEFIKESQVIRSILQEEIIEIHHMGSTSIPGMSAKPVIDMLVEVKNIDNIDKYNKELEKIGYIPKGEYGISGRRFFLKGLYERTHHIHTYQAGNPEIKRHINFRDYMIAHAEEANKYAELKIKLAQDFKHDIDGYCDGKDSFVKEIDRKAEMWAAAR